MVGLTECIRGIPLSAYKDTTVATELKFQEYVLSVVQCTFLNNIVTDLSSCSKIPISSN